MMSPARQDRADKTPASARITPTPLASPARRPPRRTPSWPSGTPWRLATGSRSIQVRDSDAPDRMGATRGGRADLRLRRRGVGAAGHEPATVPGSGLAPEPAGRKPGQREAGAG